MTLSTSADLVHNLIMDVAQRDRAALKALYRQVSGRINAVARRIVQDPAMADRIFVAAFVEIWHAAPKYESLNVPPYQWLFDILRVCAIKCADERADRNAFSPGIDLSCLASGIEAVRGEGRAEPVITWVRETDVPAVDHEPPLLSSYLFRE
jgi:DNA-directed RNA polymerase specialized sigma24 family protein